MSYSRTRRTRSRKTVPWKGWAKLAPDTRQRTKMLKDCGERCFLGPKKSFPICKKDTCEVSDKGLWAAYIRARQWGKPKEDYKGKTRPTMKQWRYDSIARKSKKMLERRGYEVGRGDAKKFSRRQTVRRAVRRRRD